MRRKLSWLAGAALLGLSSFAGAQAVGDTTSNPICPPGSLNCTPGTTQLPGPTVTPQDSQLGTSTTPSSPTTPGTSTQQLGTGTTIPGNPSLDGTGTTTTPGMGTSTLPGNGTQTLPGTGTQTLPGTGTTPVPPTPPTR
jgi:hypothetical protein